MKQKRTNILDNAVLQQADGVCVTTNAIIRRDGRAVMGAGVAKAFRDRFRGIDTSLANSLMEYGNQVSPIWKIEETNTIVFSFPTKKHWKQDSTIELITSSTKQLVRAADKLQLQNIWLPRPGCSNGRLSWTDVKEAIEPLLDNRFTICYL